jgi:hypothetical protein
MTGSTLRLALVGALLPTLLTAQLPAPLRGFDAYVAGAVQRWAIPGGSDRVTFGLNAEGSVGHLRWPGLGEFARDVAQP